MNAERLLVVNDAPDFARLLALELSHAGFDDVSICASAEEALKLVAQRRPQVVISDVNVGGIDGFQLCRILSSPAYQELQVPVILFASTYRDSRAVNLARDAGAFAFLENARDPGELVATVRQALSAERWSVSATSVAKKSRALLVDNDARTRAAVLEALEDEGFEVDFAADAVAAQNEISECDLLLVEKSLPVIGGGQVLDWIRRERPELPVVMLGEKGESWGLLLRSGADDYLEKPLCTSEVRSVCRRVLMRREYKRTSARIESSERRLRASEDRFRRQRGFLESLMDASGDGVLVCDDEYRVAQLNGAAARILGASRDKLLGTDLKSLFGAEAMAKLEGPPSSPGGESTYATFEITRAHDRGVSVLSVGFSRCDGGESGTELLIILRDVTSERRLQERLAQSQKMESMGALAGGMAHDFNNILATILPHAEMIRIMSTDDDMIRRAQAIEQAARRGGELTRRLLTFAKPRGERRGEADANVAVESTLAMLRETLDRKIRVECDLMKESVLVPMERSQIEHVLLNLGINARDAMPDGGVLRFRTRMPQRQRATGTLSPDSLVCISVEDTGCGMSADVLRRVFDPFFTTKAEGKGTGLGLSTGYSLIQAAGGFIDVESEEGRGSKFRIFLPARLYQQKPVAETPKPVRGRRERVLVVDDEESVRDLTAEMLGRLNYEVSAVSSGKEAIEYCRESLGPDLVVLDMIMPDMDGRTTYERLREVKPDLNFLLASGDVDNPLAGELASVGIEVLQKPFSLAHLSAKVSSALEGRGVRQLEQTV